MGARGVVFLAAALLFVALVLVLSARAIAPAGLEPASRGYEPRVVAASLRRASIVPGGPLSPCPGHTPFDDRYRWTNGTVHRGCATGYRESEVLDGGGAVSCGGRLEDDALTTAVSINVPALNERRGDSLWPRCGLKVRICGTSCVVTKVNDRGPYKLGSSLGGDYGRDMDMSLATRRRIGVDVSLASFGDPVIFWWRVCANQARSNVGATVCLP